MTDYERGVEQASAIYKEVIREYVTENVKLRERVEKLEELLPENGRWFSTEVVEAYIAEIEKLRELVRDMWNEGMCECGSRGKCARCEYGYPDRMRELGVEMSE